MPPPWFTGQQARLLQKEVEKKKKTRDFDLCIAKILSDHKKKKNSHNHVIFKCSLFLKSQQRVPSVDERKAQSGKEKCLEL